MPRTSTSAQRALQNAELLGAELVIDDGDSIDLLLPQCLEHIADVPGDRAGRLPENVNGVSAGLKLDRASMHLADVAVTIGRPQEGERHGNIIEQEQHDLLDRAVDKLGEAAQKPPPWGLRFGKSKVHARHVCSAGPACKDRASSLWGFSRLAIELQASKKSTPAVKP